MTPNYAELIMHMPLFQGLTVHGAQRLLDHGGISQCATGDILCREGEEALVVVLIITGKLRAFIERDGNELMVTEVGPGRIMGDVAALTGLPRAVSVRALEPTTLLSWTNSEFRKLLFGDIALSHRIFASTMRMLIDHEKSLLESVEHGKAPAPTMSAGAR